jgi:transcriptional regulator with XRE-family HTH domain
VKATNVPRCEYLFFDLSIIFLDSRARTIIRCRQMAVKKEVRKMDDVNQEFAGLIKDYMERNRLNQSELAKQTGLRQGKISMMVNGNSRISLPDFVRVGKILGPDFIKDSFNVFVRDYKYYVNLAIEKSIGFVSSVSKSAPINNDVGDLGGACTLSHAPSHELSPVAKAIAPCKWPLTIRSVQKNRMLRWINSIFGGRAKIAIDKNLNQNLCGFQLQHAMGVPAVAQGLFA